MMKKIGVLIVDDSAFMRKFLTDIMGQDKDIEVIGAANNGLEAVEMAKRLKPDIIILDIEMPQMDGLTCLKEIMKHGACKVVMLSSYTKKGQKYTIEALENGAVDFIAKPDNFFDIMKSEKKTEILDKIKIVFNTKKVKTKRIKKITYGKNLDTGDTVKRIVVIGTSTGGPRALQEVIPRIPGSIPAAFLVVQHMPRGFTASLAERLNNMSELTVKEAEDGETVRRGYVYMAPGGFHLRITGRYNDELATRITDDPPVGNHRPSVDALLQSIFEAGVDNLITVIMTGMGSDGSKGLVAVKKLKNGLVFAQDEKTSTIYGMPKSAVGTGVVDKIVPLDKIALEITNALGVR